MLTLARGFVSTEASAEEVVQETWLAVIQGIDRFEGRSSLRTWVYRILVNTAKKRGVREHRTVPWSSLAGEDDEPDRRPGRCSAAREPYPGGWRSVPVDVAEPAEGSVLTARCVSSCAVASTAAGPPAGRDDPA